MKRHLLCAGALVAASLHAACDGAFLSPDPDIDDLDPGIELQDGGPDDGGGATGPACTAVAEGASHEGPALARARYRHTATLLDDGRVLLVGGQGEDFLPVAEAEIFDPQTGAFTTTGSLQTARYDHAAVLLDDGRVLVVGGFEMGFLASVEAWDPATGAFSTTTPLPEARVGHTATRLQDGRVVILGGRNDVVLPTGVLVFDPADDGIVETAQIARGRDNHTATLLADGRVAMVGGFFTGPLADVDLIAADGSSAAPGPSLPLARRSHTATLLQDGRLLVVGGYGPGGPLAGSFLLDDAALSWSAGPDLATPRYAHAAVPLDCAVLVCAGVDAPGCEMLDVDTERFFPAAGPEGANYSFTSTTLLDGSVLFAGGIRNDAVLDASARFVVAD